VAEIQISNLVKRFGNVTAVDDVSTTFPPSANPSGWPSTQQIATCSTKPAASPNRHIFRVVVQ